jgi:hypothetical protein
MPKAPVSVTLDVANLLWLRARAAGRKRRSLSEALDEIVTAARTGSVKVQPVRSIVGTIEFTDEDLEAADVYVRELFETSLSRPLTVSRSAGATPDTDDWAEDERPRFQESSCVTGSPR